MAIWKGILVAFLMCTLLFLLLPSPAMAGDTAEGVLWIVLGLILITGIIVIGVAASGGGMWAETYDFGLGEMILDIQGNPILVNSFSPLQNSRSLSTERVDYNLDWLFTDREEGRLWIGAGLTVSSPQELYGFDLADNDYGGNLLFGFEDDQWCQKWLITYFPDGEIKANTQIYYRF